MRKIAAVMLFFVIVVGRTSPGGIMTAYHPGSDMSPVAEADENGYFLFSLVGPGWVIESMSGYSASVPMTGEPVTWLPEIGEPPVRGLEKAIRGLQESVGSP
jgi:hypothetical protein